MLDPALIRSGRNIVPAHLSAASSAASLTSELVEPGEGLHQLDGAVTSPYRPAMEASFEEDQLPPPPMAMSTPRQEPSEEPASPRSQDGSGEQTAIEAQGRPADATPSLYPSLGQLEVDTFTFNLMLNLFKENIIQPFGVKIHSYRSFIQPRKKSGKKINVR